MSRRTDTKSRLGLATARKGVRRRAGLWIVGSVVAALVEAALLASGHLKFAILFPVAALFVIATLVAPRVVRNVLMVTMFLVPLIVAVSLLHREANNYQAYYALAISAFAVMYLLRRREAPKIDVGTAFLALVLPNAVVFISMTPFAFRYESLIFPLLALGLYGLILNTKVSRTAALLLYGTVALGVVEALLGISQSLFGHPVFSVVQPIMFVSARNPLSYLVPGLSSTAIQGIGTFDHFNRLGAFLTLACPIAFGMWLGHRRSVLWIAMVCVIFAGVWTTYSRESLIGTLVGCGVVYSLSAPRSKRWMAVVGAACVLALVPVSVVLLSYLHATENMAGRNMAARFTTWSYATHYALAHPAGLVAGFGFTAFQNAILPKAPAGTRVLAYLHSAPLQVLLELGVVGFVLYVLTILIPVYHSLRFPGSLQRAMLVGAVAGFFVSQLVDNSTFIWSGCLMFAFLALLQRNLMDEGVERAHTLRLSGKSSRVPR